MGRPRDRRPDRGVALRHRGPRSQALHAGSRRDRRHHVGERHDDERCALEIDPEERGVGSGVALRGGSAGLAGTGPALSTGFASGASPAVPPPLGLSLGVEVATVSRCTSGLATAATIRNVFASFMAAPLPFRPSARKRARSHGGETSGAGRSAGWSVEDRIVHSTRGADLGRRELRADRGRDERDKGDGACPNDASERDEHADEEVRRDDPGQQCERRRDQPGLASRSERRRLGRQQPLEPLL